MPRSPSGDHPGPCSNEAHNGSQRLVSKPGHRNSDQGGWGQIRSARWGHGELTLPPGRPPRPWLPCISVHIGRVWPAAPSRTLCRGSRLPFAPSSACRLAEEPLNRERWTPKPPDGTNTPVPLALAGRRARSPPAHRSARQTQVERDIPSPVELTLSLSCGPCLCARVADRAGPSSR
jgi:hypothetical protein